MYSATTIPPDTVVYNVREVVSAMNYSDHRLKIITSFDIFDLITWMEDVIT